MAEQFMQGRRGFLKGSAAALAPLLLRGASADGAEVQATFGDKFYIPPYLSNPAVDAMTICFAAIDAQDVEVRWGKSERSLREIAPMRALPIDKITWLVWKARLKDLPAGETIYYQVAYQENGEQKTSEIHSFVPIDPQADDVRAVIYNDVHDRIATANELVQWVKPEDFTFSILLGDMWHDPSTSDNARRTFLNLEAYVRLFDGSNKPMMFVRGNHDVRGGFASQLSHLFDFPLNDSSAAFGEQNAYYDFRVGPIWFLAPDSGEDGSKKMDLFQPYRERQATWLAKLFATGPHRDAPWRVLTTHIPLYYLGYWDAPHSRELWEPVLTRGKIDVSIAGHIHACGVIPEGEEVVYVQAKGKPDEETIRYTPPFPTFIGGGPAAEVATVTFLRANARRLELRAIGVKGEEMGLFLLNKAAGAAAAAHDTVASQGTVLTFNIVPPPPKHTPMPQGYGTHVRSASMPGADGRDYGYEVVNGGTPNVAVAFSDSRAGESRFKYTIDRTWVGAAWLDSQGLGGKGWFYITFTPDSPDVGVRVRSFDLLGWDASNHGAEWRLYADAIGGAVLASG